MNTETVSRKSVPVDSDELRLAQAIRELGSPEREAVEAVIGRLPERLSEAQALSALMAVARHSVSDWVTAAGYAAYGEALDEEDRAFAASTRARRGERARRRVEAGHE